MSTLSLDRRSHVSLYQQIADYLAGEISERRLRPEMQLPSELELMAIFHVSRVTVRLAVDLLVERGLVVRKQGKGTFVAAPAVDHKLHELRGIYESLKGAGVNLQTRLIEFGLKEPTSQVRELLGGPGTLLRFKRLYCVDDVPFGLIVVWLPPEAENIKRDDVEKHMAYGLINIIGLDIERADLTIAGRQAGSGLGALLRCPATASLLVLDRVSYGANGSAREKTSFFARSDNYRFTLSLGGPVPLATHLTDKP